MNVLVYADPQAPQASLKAALSALRSLLSPRYSVQTITPESFVSHPWYTSCALLVNPACTPLAGTSSVFRYVENGGKFLDFEACQSTSSLKLTLNNLGLDLPPVEKPQINWPLPLFLASPRPDAISRTLKSLAAPSSPSQLTTFEDANDTFHFSSLANSDIICQAAHSAPDQAQDDPAVDKPKDIIVCPGGQVPEVQKTPLFDLPLYFDALRFSRQNEGCPQSDEAWGCGEVILYSEVTNSTQTILDKNPCFLSLLPTPFLCLASHQLTARGRGSNVWLSPRGALAMSLLLRVPLSAFPVHKLVFIQYLAGLAIAEACRDESVLGKWGDCIRLKWPNDVYAVMDNDGVEKRMKVGGILVNTSFGGENVDIIIGYGLNIFNRPPTISLSQLLPHEEQATSELRLERVAAAVLSKFESIWTTFLAHNGSFEPFMELYLDRWLHSNELVTLTTVSPPIKVRIVGITPDHGLLRTVREDGGSGGFVDLQPDGNSFDMMAGMIKTKT